MRSASLIFVAVHLFFAQNCYGLQNNHTKPSHAKSPTAITLRFVSAVHDGKLDEAKALVEQGADINARDEAGKNAVYASVLQKRPDMARYFLSHGSDPNVPSLNHTYPLHIAASDGSLELVKMLISYGANPNVKQGGNYTPLFHAREQDHDDVAAYLVAHGGVYIAPKEYAPEIRKTAAPVEPPRSPVRSVASARNTPDAQFKFDVAEAALQHSLAEDQLSKAKQFGGRTEHYQAAISLAKSLDRDIAALKRRGFAGNMTQDRLYLFAAEVTRLESEQARQLVTAERDDAKYGLALSFDGSAKGTEIFREIDAHTDEALKAIHDAESKLQDLAGISTPK